MGNICGGSHVDVVENSVCEDEKSVVTENYENLNYQERMVIKYFLMQ